MSKIATPRSSQGDHVVVRGSALERIVRGLMGPDASSAQIHETALGVAALNNIRDPNLIYPGMRLNLPPTLAPPSMDASDIPWESGNQATLNITISMLSGFVWTTMEVPEPDYGAGNQDPEEQTLSLVDINTNLLSPTFTNATIFSEQGGAPAVNKRAAKGISIRPPPEKYAAQQKIIAGILDRASADMGVHPHSAQYIWGTETHHSTMHHQTSGTGPQGPFQIAVGTGKDIVCDHGNKIADAIEAHPKALRHTGPEVLALLRSGKRAIVYMVTDSSGNQREMDIRDHPVASTYMGLAYFSQVGSAAGLDPGDAKNGDKIYARYNLGPRHAARVAAAAKRGAATASLPASTRRAIDRNPSFKADTAQGVLERYEKAMAEQVAVYALRFPDLVRTSDPIVALGFAAPPALLQDMMLMKDPPSTVVGTSPSSAHGLPKM